MTCEQNHIAKALSRDLFDQQVEERDALTEFEQWFGVDSVSAPNRVPFPPTRMQAWCSIPAIGPDFLSFLPDSYRCSAKRLCFCNRSGINVSYSKWGKHHIF